MSCSRGDDELTEWLNEARNLNLISHKSVDIITKYREIINYINDSPYYKPSAVAEWAKQGIADPWLIACAAAKGYVLVTLEKRSGNLSERQPSKYAKIPDVADAFNVKTIGLFEMMRILGIIM